jgi:mono/diheme cytochrome c family protein
MHSSMDRIRPALLGVVAALGLLQGAVAEDHHRFAAPPALPIYQQECAACHVAYPPGLLPRASWQRIMGQLKSHFGTDASLDSATAAELSTWLSANAAGSGRLLDPPPQDRITRSAWFVRQHDEVGAATWQRASVKSASNCSACHAQAALGDFNEHQVRIPR